MSTNGRKQKTCFLGMPSYGSMTGGASRSYWMASSKLAVDRQYQEGSLIDANCCGLWSWALTASRHGKPVDYFAMLHSDVQAQDYWLDVLIEEMESHNLDCLSAVVPIKDQHGLTSTAIGKANLNDYHRCLCRLTMTEVCDLPETFTAADCGHPDKPLLINTGCFVCKFDWEWAQRCKFAAQTRIVYNPEKKIYFAEGEPEDWHFARCLAREGKRAGATRKVAIGHRGKQDFCNTAPWGDYKFDANYLQEPLVKIDRSGWRFPHQVHGWLSETEGKALAKLGAGKRVLEIGSYCGKSTICLAKDAESVDCIDPFDGRATPSEQGTLRKFLANLSEYGIVDKVTIHRGTTAEVAGELEGDFDLAFIDGAHDFASVSHDIDVALDHLAPGGLLAFHDYRTHAGQYDGRWDPEVTQAVQEFLKATDSKLIATHDTLAIVQPNLAFQGV